MGLSRRLLPVLLAALAACQPAPPPPTAARDDSRLELRSLTLRDARHSTQPLAGEEMRAELSLIETTQSSLNERIQRWLGSLCPRSPETRAVADSAATCVQLWLAQCQQQASALAGSGTPARCRYRGETKVLLNQDYLLSLALEAYADTGGAHGMPSVSYLNIDRRDGRSLALEDLVELPPDRLQALLEKHLRLAMELPPLASLKAAGFFEDRLPPTENIALDPQGLRFTYGAYEVAPYSMGLPNIRIPYAELAPYFTPDSPLRRLFPKP